MSNDHDRTSDSPAPASDAAPVDDVLTRVLQGVRLSGASFFIWDVSWPFATPVPQGSHIAPLLQPAAQQILSYHVVTRGTAWASLPGQPPLHLQQGEVLLVPRGHAYVMASDARACECATLDTEEALKFFGLLGAGELPFVVEDGGPGPAATRVVCGFLGCDLAPFNPLLSSLPPLVRIPAVEEAAGDRVTRLIELALLETREQAPGSRAMLDRLSELLFIEVVRRCFADLPLCERGFIASLDDPIAGPALRCLHAEPQRPWTLDSLARSTGSSRSHLAERFTERLGEPPMQYLARWRAQLASQLLLESHDKLAAIAARVGYGSEAAFSRAFKRWVGVSPGAYRSARARRGGPSAHGSKPRSR